MATDAVGIPIAWIVAPENTNGQTLVEDTHKALGYEFEIEQARFDLAYDALQTEALLRRRDPRPRLNSRRPRSREAESAR